MPQLYNTLPPGTPLQPIGNSYVLTSIYYYFAVSWAFLRHQNKGSLVPRRNSTQTWWGSPISPSRQTRAKLWYKFASGTSSSEDLHPPQTPSSRHVFFIVWKSSDKSPASINFLNGKSAQLLLYCRVVLGLLLRPCLFAHYRKVWDQLVAELLPPPLCWLETKLGLLIGIPGYVLLPQQSLKLLARLQPALPP